MRTSVVEEEKMSAWCKAANSLGLEYDGGVTLRLPSFDFDANIPDALYWRPAFRCMAEQDPEFWKRVTSVSFSSHGYYELKFVGAMDWKALGVFDHTFPISNNVLVVTRLPEIGYTIPHLMPDGPEKSAFLKLEEALLTRNAFDVRLADNNQWVGTLVRDKARVTTGITAEMLEACGLERQDTEYRLRTTPPPTAVPVTHLLAKAYAILRDTKNRSIRRYARLACGLPDMDEFKDDEAALEPLLTCRDPASLQRFINFAEAVVDPKLLDADDNDHTVTDVVVLHARASVLLDSTRVSFKFVRKAFFGGESTFVVTDVSKLREALSFLRELKRLAKN
jgi:hypothetical protein